MKIPQTLLFCVAATVCRSRVIHHGRVATPVTFGRIRIFLDAQMLAANATDLETLWEVLLARPAQVPVDGVESPLVPLLPHVLR